MTREQETIRFGVIEQDDDGRWIGRIETTTRAAFGDRAREIVGGWFDVAASPNGDSLYVNDEGLLIGMPLNPYAPAWFDRMLVGPMVITGPVDFEGYDADIRPETLALMLATTSLRMDPQDFLIG
jgi:hypothetical protein